MLSKEMLGWGAVLDGVLIAATQFMGWPGSLNYLWALLALAWGAAVLTQKRK